MMIDPDLVALLDERLEAIRASVDQLALMAANVRMANGDDETYVVLDNLRRMPKVLGQLHLRLGRLNAAAEQAEDRASQVSIHRR